MAVLSHAGWGTALVAEFHQRNRVYGWIQAVGVIGAASVLLLPLGLVQGLHVKIGSISVMGLFFLVAVPLTFAVTVLFAPEPKHLRHHAAQNVRARDLLALITRPDMARNLAATLLTTFGPAITAPLYLFFFQKARGYLPWHTTVLLIIYILAGLVGPAFWTRVAVRVGKQQTVKIASVAYAIAQTCLLLLPSAHVVEMSVAMFTVGFVASAFAFILRAMVADICDEVRLETGADRTALIYGLATSTAKFASTVSVGVAYPVLSVFGFRTAEGAVNTSSAMWGLQALYLVPPVACVLLGGLAMLGYRMNEQRHNEVREALHARDRAMAGTPDVQPATMSQLQPGE
jgi:Na+/melibiose symporter-like transporter